MTDKKIKKCVSECKWNQGINLFMILGFTFVFSILGIMAIQSWWVIPISLIISHIMVFINTSTTCFSFQEINTTIKVDPNPNNTNVTENKLGYITVKVIGDSDSEGKCVCSVSYIDGKYVNGVNVIIPKSEIFRKEKFYWNQSFKPIG